MREALEYFLLESSSDPRQPMIGDVDDDIQFGRGRAVPVTKTIQMEVPSWGPRKPHMTDILFNGYPLITDRVKAVLEPLNLYGVEYHPVSISTRQGEFPYWMVHIWNRFSCVDRLNSDVVWDSFIPNRVHAYTQVILDEDVLAKIPLEQRLMFTLAEECTFMPIHRSVREVIESVKPTGCRWYAVHEWNLDGYFKKEKSA